MAVPAEPPPAAEAEALDDDPDTEEKPRPADEPAAHAPAPAPVAVTLAPEAEPPAPAPVAAAETAAAPWVPSAAELLARLRATAPAPIPEVRLGGDSGVRTFKVSFEGAVRLAELPSGLVSAEAATRAADQLGAARADLLGRAEGCWRFARGGERVAADAAVDGWDPDQVVDLEFQANHVLPVAIEVRGLADPIRFRAPVGVAVPARALVEHLRRWLSLPGDAWVLVESGRALHPYEVLADRGATEATTLVVTR